MPRNARKRADAPEEIKEVTIQGIFALDWRKAPTRENMTNQILQCLMDLDEESTLRVAVSNTNAMSISHLADVEGRTLFVRRLFKATKIPHGANHIRKVDMRYCQEFVCIALDALSRIAQGKPIPKRA